MILTHGMNSIERDEFVEIGGRRYPVVKIGNQLWMAENLDWKFDVNGSQIPIGQSGIPTTPAAWYYNNDEATYGWSGKKYGLLYNGYAVDYIRNNPALIGVPTGWHVPTKSEWQTLLTSVGGASVAAKKLKASTEWASGAGTDDFGFSAFPGGQYNGNFYLVDTTVEYWASSLYNSSSYDTTFFDTNDAAVSSYDNFTSANYIRLVKDIT